MTGETQLRQDAARQILNHDVGRGLRILGLLAVIVTVAVLAAMGLDALDDLLARGFASLGSPSR